MLTNMDNTRSNTRYPLVLRHGDFQSMISEAGVLDALRNAFTGLAQGTTIQPPQSAGLVPNQVDVIWYPGILGGQKIFGVKASPYFPGRQNGPKVTAWTVLFSAETGEPLLLCDSLSLTTERTAATTLLAVDCLAPRTAKSLAVFGVGAVAMAHLRYAFAIRNWEEVHLYSRSLASRTSVLDQLPVAVRSKVKIASSAEAAIATADVILLCTSSAAPVIDHQLLRHGQIVTSISTNAPNAHEIAPAALSAMEVYCDYRVTTPAAAGEMKLATASHNWSPSDIRGDLPELLTKQAPLPTGRVPAFFRSIGLGIEDLAIANLLLGPEKNLVESKSQGGIS